MRNRHFEHVRGKGGSEESRWGMSCGRPCLPFLKFSNFPGVQIDMSNIIDQAQKIIDANGFTDSAFFFLFLALSHENFAYT